MSELQTAADSFPIWKAMVWIFYPMTALVLVEVFLRLFNNDDDDDEGGKGIRVWQPAYAPSGT
mgnify:CR=1 FL=1|tara:strand:- start:124 stop:312 length:189 start_codon:yes stop_codon:yes gene_type:complete